MTTTAPANTVAPAKTVDSESLQANDQVRLQDTAAAEALQAKAAAQSIPVPPFPVPKFKAAPQKVIDEKVAILENAFNLIYKERMHDVPILNDKVEVRVIGFQQWNNSYLCIMITPWFMNLMLLPGETENWDDKQETSSSRHTFPSGNYQFLVGFEPAIGKYQMCSLFSPMFEFADNDAAVETAEVAIKELMNVENIEEVDIDSRQLEAIWDGTEEHPDKIATREAAEKAKAEAEPRKPLQERMQQPVSRRHLLRGALMLEDDAAVTQKVATQKSVTQKTVTQVAVKQTAITHKTAQQTVSSPNLNADNKTEHKTAK